MSNQIGIEKDDLKKVLKGYTHIPPEDKEVLLTAKSMDELLELLRITGNHFQNQDLIREIIRLQNDLLEKDRHDLQQKIIEEQKAKREEKTRKKEKRKRFIESIKGFKSDGFVQTHILAHWGDDLIKLGVMDEGDKYTEINKRIKVKQKYINKMWYVIKHPQTKIVTVNDEGVTYLYLQIKGSKYFHYIVVDNEGYVRTYYPKNNIPEFNNGIFL